MIDFNELAKPAPEQRDQFINESATEDAKALTDGLRNILRLMAEVELQKYFEGRNDEI